MFIKKTKFCPKHFFRIKIDDELILSNDELRDKKRNLIMVVCVFLTITAMIVLDFASKWRNSLMYKKRQIFERKGTAIVTIFNDDLKIDESRCSSCSKANFP